MSDWVIMASGPSLCAEDVKVVRGWHRNGGGTAVVINTTFRMAPWADILYACDGGWWRVYGAEAEEKHKGRKYCYSETGRKYGAQSVRLQVGHGGLSRIPGTINSGGNSGHQAIHLARDQGAKRIMLLGFDMAHTHGQAHWHGNHPPSLGNASNIKNWIPHMNKLAQDLAAEGVEVINCSRHTALECFKRMPIDDALSNCP